MKAAAAAGARLWVDAEKVSMALVAAAEGAAGAPPAEGGEAASPPAKKRKAAKHAAAASAAASAATVKEGVSPIPLAKAIKNEVELAGMVEAHLRDGVAMASFWCWLDQQAAAVRRCRLTLSNPR